MVDVSLDSDRVRLDVRGLHQLWALKRKLELPRAAIASVRRLAPDALRGVWKGWRVPGTHVPGVIVAGTYYKAGERHFWDVRHADRAIEIELSGAAYDRVYVEVDDPDAVIEALAPRA